MKQTTDKTHYVAGQIDRLNPTPEYSHAIKITDGDGNHTNYMNITPDQLQAIKATLTAPDRPTLEALLDAIADAQGQMMQAHASGISHRERELIADALTELTRATNKIKRAKGYRQQEMERQQAK